MSQPSKLKALVQPLEITPTAPGTLLYDFDQFVRYINKHPAPLTKSKKQPTQKWAASLNNELAHPAVVTLARPFTIHYPTILGLCLISRTSGICKLVRKSANKSFLTIDKSMLTQWQQLTPAEQYFNLISAWLLRGHASLIGEKIAFRDDRFISSAGTGELRNDLFDGKALDSLWLEYLPFEVGAFNLALLKLTGLAILEFTDNNLKISECQLTPLGLSILGEYRKLIESLRFQPANQATSFQEDSILLAIPSIRPDVNKSLSLPAVEKAGGYHLQVALPYHNCSRTLAVDAKHTLDALAMAIVQAFDFEDDEHLYFFQYHDRFGIPCRIIHPELLQDNPTTENTRLEQLEPEEGQQIEFIFDLGDQWEFSITVIKTVPDPIPTIKLSDSKGEAPDQYPKSEGLEFLGG